MRRGFYIRLAWDGIRKNRRLFVPYLITCICMVMMYYILSFLASPAIVSLLPRGASSTAMIMTLGSYVVLLFSLIFLYYTNSFLIRRRQKEFGLYNVLGMNKRNLARIITLESLITAAVSLVLGLALGILLSKIAELGLMNMVGGEVTLRFHLHTESLLNTVLFYAVIFLVIWFSALFRVRRSTAIRLLKSENVGEKPPKSNWLLALIGAILLAGAYYLAVAVSNPLDAVVWFFIAVLMVIVATYLLMIAGSVSLCRILQKNKKYYYHPRHFVSVSSMVYRMKRNGAGLASICIIATMVLVMISSSSCLYYGAEDAIRARYPRHINVEVRLDTPEQLSDENTGLIRGEAEQFLAEQGITPLNPRSIRYINLTGLLDGTVIQCDHETVDAAKTFGTLRDLFLISAEDYREMSGENLTLAPGEIAVLTSDCDYDAPELTVCMGDNARSYSVVSCKEGSLLTGEPASIIQSLILIVPDLSEAVTGLRARDSEGNAIINYRYLYGFDTELDADGQLDLRDTLEDRLGFISFGEGQGYEWLNVEAQAGGRSDFYGANGALFFIGIMLSIVFLFAAVLIIYYKQICEGYEDQPRFEIMQKVGMTRREIRKSVNSQLLTVFFAPLLFAGVHLTFAFPMIRKLLTLFALYNLSLFLTTTLISFAVFALFYTLVYRITSNTYYSIVSGGRSADA